MSFDYPGGTSNTTSLEISISTPFRLLTSNVMVS